MSIAILMPQLGQKGLTFRASFVKGIEEFIDRHPELGWTSVPEAVRHAWVNFAVDYEEKRERISLQNEAITPID